MTALYPQHRLWVIAMFANGDMDYTKAARDAGYKDTGTGSIRVQGHRIAHRPDVKAAMQEEASRQVTMMLPLAARAMAVIASTDTHKDQHKVALAIMSRAGVHEATERNINVNMTLTDAEKVEKIRLLAEKYDLPVGNLLPDAVDVEFHDVATSDPALLAYLEGPEDEY